MLLQTGLVGPSAAVRPPLLESTDADRRINRAGSSGGMNMDEQDGQDSEAKGILDRANCRGLSSCIFDRSIIATSFLRLDGKGT